MNILLINPPYVTLTSRLGVGHQIPLGLLMVGGALQQAGHAVRLLDAECQHLSADAIVRQVAAANAQVVMTGHAGSTPAHPVCMEMLQAIKRRCPGVTTIYGGPYPTYHAADILARHLAVDVIVRGEGEATAVELAEALAAGRPLGQVPGLALRDPAGRVVFTPERPPISLDRYPIGWNLLENPDAYQCFGLGRAAIVQFSRGCPHGCSYCGQRGFWIRWRHRDPAALVEEIAWLAREKHVRFITLADENPTTDPRLWRTFLELLAARQTGVQLFATIRARDIVRDRDFLHLYRQAGLLYVLMGIETTDPATLAAIRKGSTTRTDYEACQLLKCHGIHSIIGYIVGLGTERWGDFWQAWRQLAAYDGDYLNAMYATPHAWTAFAQEVAQRRIVEPNPAHWDYRHQILAHEHIQPWQILLCVKLLELAFHLRPRRLWRLLAAGPAERHQFWWCLRHTGAVWLAEIVAFCASRRERRPARTVQQWFGATLGEALQQQRLVALRIQRREVA